MFIIFFFFFATCTSPPGGGGGGTSICMHIGYVPRERPPFSALNFRSGAYHFHKLSVPGQQIRSGASPFYIFWRLSFCRSGDHHFQNPETIFNFILFIASHGRLSPNAKRSAAPRISGRSGDSHFHAQNGSSSFRSPAFSRSKRLKLVPEPRIFKLKTAQARSGAPHFHARPGARSGALAHAFFTLPRHIPTKIWGEYPPPPPQGTSMPWRS